MPKQPRPAWRRYLLIGAGILAVALIVAASRHREARERAELATGRTCYLTAGGALQVCHKPTDEGVYYKPSASQVAYNVLIIRYDDDRFATVLHSEARDLQHYKELTGRVRPGDSIKVGTVNAGTEPAAVYSAPPNLDYKIWGA